MSIHESSTREILGSSGLFGSLTGGQLDELSRTASLRRLHRGETVFRTGESARGLFMVLEGRVCVILVSDQGRERVLYLVGPGQSFGETSLFMHDPYPIRVESVPDSVVLHIAAPQVMKLIDSNKEFVQQLLRSLAARVNKINRNEVLLRRTYSAEQRVAAYLIELLEHDGGDGAARVRLPGPKGMVASYLCFTRETLSRALRELSNRKLISVRGDCVDVLDLDSLRRLLGGAIAGTGSRASMQ